MAQGTMGVWRAGGGIGAQGMALVAQGTGAVGLWWWPGWWCRRWQTGDGGMVNQGRAGSVGTRGPQMGGVGKKKILNGWIIFFKIKFSNFDPNK